MLPSDPGTPPGRTSPREHAGSAPRRSFRLAVVDGPRPSGISSRCRTLGSWQPLAAPSRPRSRCRPRHTRAPRAVGSTPGTAAEIGDSSGRGQQQLEQQRTPRGADNSVRQAVIGRLVEPFRFGIPQCCRTWQWFCASEPSDSSDEPSRKARETAHPHVVPEVRSKMKACIRRQASAHWSWCSRWVRSKKLCGAPG